MLILQFFWKYIDDLMGKGLAASTILELLFYISASLIPLALPLAILLSSIMTLGNMSENNELTALKSSGLSLYRILRPLTGVILIIATATFFFANYVIPVSTLKWHTLIFDIQNIKIGTILTPGAYSEAIEGYAIKIESGDGNKFEKIIIHDHTDPKSIKTIRAKRGTIYKSEKSNEIFFDLEDGNVIEELNPTAPLFNNDGKVTSPRNDYPSRRSSFEQATYKINLAGFDLNKSKEEMFQNKYDMLNVFQIKNARDSIDSKTKEVIQNFLTSLKGNHPYFQSHSFILNSSKDKTKYNTIKADMNVTQQLAIDTIVSYSSLSAAKKIIAINYAQTKLRNKNNQLTSQASYIKSLKLDKTRFMIEFHRKFALTFAIIILFFVGAPLGAIIRKGGFGAPVVIAALLFMVYFVLLTIGDNLAGAHSVSPFVGMWFPSLTLLPFAILLMRAAANDRPVFNIKGLIKLIKRN